MFEKTNKAVARRVGKVAVEAQSRNFTIRIDEPKTSGGEDTGMSPVEALLCSLGACQVVAACVFARQMRIELDDIWVEVEGRYGLRRHDGLYGHPPRLPAHPFCLPRQDRRASGPCPGADRPGGAAVPGGGTP